MMAMKQLLLRALLLSLILVAHGSASTAPKTVKLLTIGNSFSGNATHYLGDLAKAGGHTLVHQPMSIHWWVAEAGTVPSDQRGILNWVDDIWREVDAWVEAELTSPSPIPPSPAS